MTRPAPRLAQVDQQDRHQSIEQGRFAQTALGYMQIAIGGLEEIVISRLVAGHRSGKVTEAELRGGLGEIVGYRNVLQALKNDVQRASIAMEEEMRDGGS